MMNSEKNNNSSLSDEHKSQNNNSVQSAQMYYRGPLPPAQELARYEQIKEGLANRIITLAEKNLSIGMRWIK